MESLPRPIRWYIRRIYHFLEDIGKDIVAEKNEARFRPGVDQEHSATQSQPQGSNADSVNDEKCGQRCDEYLSV